MKIICPISGVPFRTYDSLRMAIACEHPIFSLPFESLTVILNDIKEQEDEFLQTIQSGNNTETQLSLQAQIANTQKEFTNKAIEAIAEKNWRNPVFKLYQSKHLVMLAFMKQADLLQVETGYCARPSPQLIDAYFWSATELFIWAATIRSEHLKEQLPKYRISKHNENFSNLSDYLDLLYETKYSIGNKYRSISDENKLRAMEMALAMLNKHRSAQKKELTGGSTIAAKWALTITNCPKDIYDFWFEILKAPSIGLTFNGVKVGDKWESVTVGDLRELRDYLEENLIGPRGEGKQSHLDDSEYYFTARQVVLNIIRKHIATIEQGTTAYQIVNVAMGSSIVSATDDSLERLALSAGLDPKPDFALFVGRKLEFLRAMAAWRTKTKEILIKKQEEAATVKDNEDKSKGGGYEIL